jgi:hypothetical protein
MKWNLHQLIIEGVSNDGNIQRAWQTSFASLPGSDASAHLHYQLDLVANVPQPPVGDADFRQEELLAYYVRGETAVVHFPRFGQLTLDLAHGHTRGQIVAAALSTYGVLEDLIAIGLSPHLRRHGQFLIHAFAAAYNGKAVLLVGGIGAGKTTTGMSLLNGGWQLLSNDSPIVTAQGDVLSYPGVLAAYPDSFARFPSTAHLARQEAKQDGRPKLSIPAESVWPSVWGARAPVGAILFPRIAGEGRHRLEPISTIDTLRQLLPHAVEQWDKAMMPAHLAVLRQLVEAAPGYVLHLGPDVLAIPEALAVLAS